MQFSVRCIDNVRFYGDPLSNRCGLQLAYLRRHRRRMNYLRATARAERATSAATSSPHNHTSASEKTFTYQLNAFNSVSRAQILRRVFGNASLHTSGGWISAEPLLVRSKGRGSVTKPGMVAGYSSRIGLVIIFWFYTSGKEKQYNTLL